MVPGEGSGQNAMNSITHIEFCLQRASLRGCPCLSVLNSAGGELKTMPLIAMPKRPVDSEFVLSDPPTLPILQGKAGFYREGLGEIDVLGF